MVHGSDSVTKRNLRRILTRHYPGDRFDDLMRGEFYNGAFKKSLLLSHESPLRKQHFPFITG